MKVRANFTKVFLLLSVIILELIGHVFFPQFLADDFYNTLQRDFANYRHFPNSGGRHRTWEFDYHIEINEDGYRDDIRLAELGPDDIIFLGDGITLGYGVDLSNSFVKIVPKLLVEKTGIRVNSLNTGMAGVGPLNYVRGYRKNLVKKPHRLVVFDYFAMNDFVGAGDIDHAFGPDTASKSKTGSGQTEPLWVTVRYQILSFFSQNSFIYGVFRTIKNTDNFVSRSLFGFGIGHDIYSHSRTKDRLADPEMLAVNCNFIERTARFVAGNGNDFVFVLFPRRDQVEDIKGFWHGQNDVLKPSDSISNLVECIKRKGVLAINLTPELRENFLALNEPLYFPYDGHLNVHGNRLAAEIIAEHISRFYR